MTKYIPALLLAALMSTPATAAESKKVHPTEARPDDLICTYEKATGSHLKKRICVSRADREARAKADQDAMHRLNGSGAQSNKD